MVISAITITMSESEPAAWRTRTELASFDWLELGPMRGRRLAAVLVASSAPEAEERFDRIGCVPGVHLVDLVMAHFDGGDGDTASGSPERGKQPSRGSRR